uniref:Uncharacterized protein n=1 Tax=Romanomermis culicivorax TaxID=13658 RepID=A0A915JYK7_ROMCU
MSATPNYFNLTIARGEEKAHTSLKERFLTSLVHPEFYLSLKCHFHECNEGVTIYLPNGQMVDDFQMKMTDVNTMIVHILINGAMALGQYTCYCGQSKFVKINVNYRLCMSPDICNDAKRCSKHNQQLAGCVVKLGATDTCPTLTAEDCKTLHDHHFLTAHTAKSVVCDTARNRYSSACEALSTANRMRYLPVYVTHENRSCRGPNHRRLIPNAVYKPPDVTAGCALDLAPEWSLVPLFATVHFLQYDHVFCYICDDTSGNDRFVTFTIGLIPPYTKPCREIGKGIWVATIDVSVNEVLSYSGSISFESNVSYVEFLYSIQRDQINAKLHILNTSSNYIEQLHCETSVRTGTLPQVYFDFVWLKDNVRIRATELHRRTGISILYPREPGYYQCIVLVQYCAYNPDAQDLGSIRSRAVNITSNMLQPVIDSQVADVVLYVSLCLGVLLFVLGIGWGLRVMWKNRKNKEKMRYLMGSSFTEKDEEIIVRSKPSKRPPKSKSTVSKKSKSTESPPLTNASIRSIPTQMQKTAKKSMITTGVGTQSLISKINN